MEGRARALAAALAGSASCLVGVDYHKVGVGDFCVAPGPEPSAESCRAGLDACGAARNEPCCTSLPVPCGSFQRDYDGVSYTVSDGRGATVSDFRLDKFEVTVGRFRAFVSAGAATGDNPEPPAQGAGSHPKYLASGWNPADVAELAPDAATLAGLLACGDNRATWTDAPGDNENRPINCVTWYEALLFCAWDGGRLPTEAEWSYAAAGGSEQREYPWLVPAHDVSLDLAVYGCPMMMVACPVGTSIAVVGSKPAGRARWGQDDLAGNVAEWVLDSVGADDEYLSPCDDCLRLDGPERGVRGGAFDTVLEAGGELRVSRRGSLDPATRAPGLGFRCVRPIAP
jgi:formylglycine-generating enzyme required for sulfatase activity